MSREFYQCIEEWAARCHELDKEIERLTLRWSSEKPSQPGFYWWKGTGVHSDPMVVEVRKNWLVGCFKKPLSEWVLELGGEWAGPIETPQ